MVEDGSCQEDVVRFAADLHFSDIPLDCLDLSLRHRSDPLDGSVQHGFAQVNERHVQVRQMHQQLEGVVSR